MRNNYFKGLVSPKTGVPLRQINDALVTDDGKERFFIKNGLAFLLNPNELDDLKRNEIEVFDNLDFHNVSFFRESLLQNLIQMLSSHFEKSETLGETFRVTEMGGGEGHFARYIAATFPDSEVFVCDLSSKTLERAPKNLRRVCADVTRPIFERDSISLASFWVSLHHLEKRLWRNALEEVANALEENGILIIFEPNSSFYPRQIMYQTRLSRDVYPDKYEQAVDFLELSALLKDLSLVEIGTYYLNPPYNFAFVRKLKRWYLYMPVVESLHLLDQWILGLIFKAFFPGPSSLKRYLALYGLAIYKKPHTR